MSLHKDCNLLFLSHFWFDLYWYRNRIVIGINSPSKWKNSKNMLLKPESLRMQISLPANVILAAFLLKFNHLLWPKNRLNRVEYRTHEITDTKGNCDELMLSSLLPLCLLDTLKFLPLQETQKHHDHESDVVPHPYIHNSINNIPWGNLTRKCLECFRSPCWSLLSTLWWSWQ